MTKQRQMLRSEAAAVNLSSLTLSQMQAFSKLANLLDEALANSNAAIGNRQVSRLAFVSGAKGTGKSSLLHTLEKACKHGENLPHEIKNLKDAHMLIRDNQGQEEDKSIAAERKDRSNAILEALIDVPVSFTDIQRKCTYIRWLKPLSLDPLPQGTNLLAAVMARIEVAVNEASSSNRQRYGSLDPYGHMDRARHQLTSLKTEAVKALEGNLELHAPTMDTTTHAIAATEAELSKVTLGEKLDGVLDSVLFSHAGDVRNDPASMPGMFVMFIDDLNLCPSKAVEVIKLAHLLSSRRLFYIFLGEIEDLTRTLFFKVQGDLKKLLGVADRTSELRNIETEANEIAFSLIRKLLPENQRIHVSDMTVPEALDYDCMAGQDVSGNEQETLARAIDLLPPFPNDLVSSQPKDKLSTWEVLWNEDGKVSVEYRTDEKRLVLTRRVVPSASPVNLSSSAASNPQLSTSSIEEGGKGASETKLFGMFEPAGWFQMRHLLDKHVGHGYAQAHEVIYDGANVLKSTPRHIGDALHLLDVPDDFIKKIVARQSNSPELGPATNSRENEDKKLVIAFEAATHKITEWLFTMFKGHVGEDGQLTVPVQQKLRACAEKHMVWELSVAQMRVRALVGDTLTIRPVEWRNTLALSPVNMHLDISRVLRFDIEVLKEHSAQHERTSTAVEDYAVLGPRTRPSFKLVHDFMLFSGSGVLTQTLPHKNLEDIASVRWATGYGKEEMQIPWATQPWHTFWRSDIFRDLWNHTFETARAMTRGNAVLDRTELMAFLALSWISSTLITLDAQPGDLGMFDCQDDGNTPVKNGQNDVGATSTQKVAPKSLREWGKRILGTKLFEDAAGRCDCNCKGKSERAFWVEENNPLIEDFGKSISIVIDKAFDTVEARLTEGKFDLFTQILNEKLIEMVLMCMPEAGPMMFFTQNMAYVHEGKGHEYKANPFAKTYLLIATTIAKRMTNLKGSSDKTQSGIYYDMIRMVREKRLKNFGKFVTTNFGIGLLFMNEWAFRGLDMKDLKVPCSGKADKGRELSCFAEDVGDELRSLFNDSMPRISSFHAAYHLHCEKADCLNSERKAITDWLDIQVSEYKVQQKHDLSKSDDKSTEPDSGGTPCDGSSTAPKA